MKNYRTGRKFQEWVKERFSGKLDVRRGIPLGVYAKVTIISAPQKRDSLGHEITQLFSYRRCEGSGVYGRRRPQQRQKGCPGLGSQVTYKSKPKAICYPGARKVSEYNVTRGFFLCVPLTGWRTLGPLSHHILNGRTIVSQQPKRTEDNHIKWSHPCLD